MIDHLKLQLSDYQESVAFYDRALRPLGYVRLFSSETEGLTTTAYGDTRPVLWLGPSDKPSSPVHVALHAGSREAVDAFHEAALSAGAKDNGPPGYRSEYYSGYYAAYVIDPAGNNIEAVYHDSSMLGSS